MGSKDPNIDAKAAFPVPFRHPDDPLYRVVSSFFSKLPDELILFTDRVEALPTIGWLVPESQDLRVLPSLGIRFESAAQPRIVMQLAYVELAKLTTMPGVHRLNQAWARGVGEILMRRAWLDDLTFAMLNAGHIDLTIIDERQDIPGDAIISESAKWLILAFAWRSWEYRKVKWGARATETVELGIYGSMKEDNLRRICRKAGLLKPHSVKSRRHQAR